MSEMRPCLLARSGGPQVLARADRLAELAVGLAEPQLERVEDRMRRQQTVNAVLAGTEWLSAEQINALRPVRADGFNQGWGSTRFAPLYLADGRPVPTWCAASTVDGALMESLLHHVPLALGARRAEVLALVHRLKLHEV